MASCTFCHFNLVLNASCPGCYARRWFPGDWCFSGCQEEWKVSPAFSLVPFTEISLYSIVMQVVQGKTDLQGFQSGCGEDCPGWHWSSPCPSTLAGLIQDRKFRKNFGWMSLGWPRPPWYPTFDSEVCQASREGDTGSIQFQSGINFGAYRFIQAKITGVAPYHSTWTGSARFSNKVSANDCWKTTYVVVEVRLL